MQVFVTGATGFIGYAVVRELIEAGHGVLGLARNDAGAEALRQIGADVHRGELTDTDVLATGARICDGVIHTAFMRPPAGYVSASAIPSYVDSSQVDREAIQALGTALAGSGRPLVVTSGTLAVLPGQTATEEDPGDPASPAGPRVPSEELALSMTARGVRSMLVRLPPTVHGDGDRGFMSALISAARKAGTSAFVDDGANRWPAVHRLDAARAFRLALEDGQAGRRCHAVAEEGVVFRAIAEVIGRRLNLPTVSISPAEANDRFGPLGPLIAADAPATSRQTREHLGWTPSHADLIADLDRDEYFRN